MFLARRFNFTVDCTDLIALSDRKLITHFLEIKNARPGAPALKTMATELERRGYSTDPVDLYRRTA